MSSKTFHIADSCGFEREVPCRGVFGGLAVTRSLSGDSWRLTDTKTHFAVPYFFPTIKGARDAAKEIAEAVPDWEAFLGALGTKRHPREQISAVKEICERHAGVKNAAPRIAPEEYRRRLTGAAH